AGALASQVVPNGPAAKAGIKGGDQKIHFQGQQVDAGGDVILAVDGHKIVSPSDLSSLISQYNPGDTVTLQVLRDGDTSEVDVTLGERPIHTPSGGAGKSSRSSPPRSPRRSATRPRR